MRRSRGPKLNHLWIARKRCGFGQKNVARLLGHKGTSPISEYENGRFLPSLRTALKLAAIYDTPVEELFLPLTREVEEELTRGRSHVDHLRDRSN